MVGESGDDLFPTILGFCERESIRSAVFSGLGGFREATFGYYNVQTKVYEPVEFSGQGELISFDGNVARFGNDLKLHIHCAVGTRDGRTIAGHLLRAVVRPTLEITIDELSLQLERREHPEFCIPLLEL